METRTVEQVESWSTRSFADGFAGLRELSDGEFSGAVRANGAWLFMLNGRIIGVYEGSLDDFENADGTAYAAPHPSLPLLFSMQEQGGDTRAKYYTNDTPLKEVDSTLSEGSFTGFVELSENVLSGDYYVAFYGGRSMSVAFVGASDQVVTGDDAFERAADEVGIYEVTDVDLEVTDVPEPEDDEPDAGADAPSGTPAGETSEPVDGSSQTAGSSPASGAQGTGTADDPGGRTEQIADQSAASESPTGQSSTGRSSAASSSSPAESEASRPVTDAIRQPESESGTADPEPAPGTTAESTPAETTSAETTPAETTPTESASAETTPTESVSTEPTPTESKSSAGRTSGAGGAAPTREGATEPKEGPTATQNDSPATRNDSPATQDDSPATRNEAADRTESAEIESDASGDEADALAEEEEWRETKTIPSLDPDRSESPNEDARQGSTGAGSASTGTSTTATSTESASRARANPKSSNSAKSEASGAGASGRASESGQAGNSGPAGKSGRTGDSAETDGDARARIEKLRSQLQQRKQRVQKLKKRLSKVESERDEFERERDALRQEVQRLEAELESAGSGGSSDGQRLSGAQAFDGTNLFVRYQSKGKATLEEAAAGEADPEDVNANLRLEHHTQFETDGATVEGEAFEAFLTGSFEYRLVSWIIEDLLYEIRDTGHRGNLQDLYEAIPKIDRVDLHGSVSAGGEDEDTRKESFDVIARDRMGNPLLVADLNDSRDPTTGDMMGSLVDAASGVGEAHDELSGAFQVTESFFEPEALETADTATTGGFLSREKRESFVKLSRKRGYHLCLVESRSGGFHLNVPEL
jgi:hypothetical protein